MLAGEVLLRKVCIDAGHLFYPADGCVPGPFWFQDLCRCEKAAFHLLLFACCSESCVGSETGCCLCCKCKHLLLTFLRSVLYDLTTKPAVLSMLLSSESFFACFCPKSIHVIHSCPSLCHGWKICAVAVSDGGVAGSAWQGSFVKQQPASCCGFVREDGMLLFEQRPFYSHSKKAKGFEQKLLQNAVQLFY